MRSYKEIKAINESKIFESEDFEKIPSIEPEEIKKAEDFYNYIVEQLEQGKDIDEIDEGLLTGLLGGAAGALVGPAIGKAICKVLGIDVKGHLGKLMTSRLVTTALGYTLSK